MTRTLLASRALAALAVAPFSPARAASETVLYSFCSQTNCTDGANPLATLVADAAGNFYGTTYDGGATNDGEVFKLAPDGTLTVLHSFAGTDGAFPYAGVIMDSGGNLYGTTAEGGNGFGTVFKLASDGTFSTLYGFHNSDGAEPLAGLLMDAGGNLYGTTAEDNQVGRGGGVVFEIAEDGTEKQLYSFCSQSGCSDGAVPYAPLIMDSSGNLYGTAAEGGIVTGSCNLGCGTVFEITSGGKEKTLHTFLDEQDGAAPLGGLAFGTGKSLIGVTSSGGSHDDGTVFKVSRKASFRGLHEFGGKGDAQLPYAALIPDGGGGFYGTACIGGASKKGAVFNISSTGAETVVYSFLGGSDGRCPAGSLLQVNGTLYGTTLRGGGNGCTQGYGCGTVFAIKE